MFTGIIEEMAVVSALQPEGSNLHITFSCSFARELKVDQSIAHNGVCLTAVAVNNDTYTVTVIEESLQRSNLGQLEVGDRVNIERCMPAHGRFDGHMVQGHVDTTAHCTSVEEKNGSWEFWFAYRPEPSHLTVPKGSITINGVSLTVVNSGDNEFSVAIIPYTYEHTNFKDLRSGTSVKLEFDIVGKYVAKLLGLSQGSNSK